MAFMKFMAVVAKAISNVWKFATTVFFIAVFMAFVVFILLVLMPDAVLGAIGIITGWLTEVGIVGSG